MASNPPLNDVITYLTGAGLGLTFGTNLFASLMPDSPDTCVTVIEYPGAGPDWMMGIALPGVEETNYQVVARVPEASYNANQTTIQNIYRSISTVVDQQIGGTNYLWFEPLHSPAFSHRDEKRRIHHLVNFVAMRQPN